MIRALKTHVRHYLDGRQTVRFEVRARSLNRQPAPGGRALLFTAAGVGSLGDEAMLVAAGYELRRRGVAHLTLVSYGRGTPWPVIDPFDEVLDFGRRYALDFWSTAEQWLDACASATHALILGADVMDGHYNPNECIRRCVYARIAAAAGLWTTIGGFSFNERPHPWCVESIRALPPTVHVVARDPLSRQRLEVATGRPVIGGADLAFLLAPATASPVLDSWRPWLAAERAAGRLVVGVNANLLAADDAGDDLIQSYAQGLAHLHAERGPVSLAMLPHDVRKMKGRLDDQTLLEAIAARLPADLTDHVRVLDEPTTAADLKALAGDTDLVVTGRMHLAIAALGMGVPAGGIVYQGKFEGLYRHLELEGLCLTPENMVEGERFGRFLVDLVDRREALSDDITARLPAVRELSLQNYKDLPCAPEATN